MSLAPLMSSVDMTWRTPRALLELVRAVSVDGSIALDPATAADNPCGARRFFTPVENAFSQDWNADGGLIYCNPPYGRELGAWTARFAVEGKFRELVALVPARPDTRWWHRDMLTADLICFWRGRLRFSEAKESAPFPSAVAYWGQFGSRFVEVFGPHGWVVPAGSRLLGVWRRRDRNDGTPVSGGGGVESL